MTAREPDSRRFTVALHTPTGRKLTLARGLDRHESDALLGDLHGADAEGHWSPDALNVCTVTVTAESPEHQFDATAGFIAMAPALAAARDRRDAA